MSETTSTGKRKELKPALHYRLNQSLHNLQLSICYSEVSPQNQSFGKHFFPPIKPKCLPSSLLVSDIYASWCLDSPTDQCQPAQLANVIFVLHRSQITQPTGYLQPSSQNKASTRCSQASLQQCTVSLAQGGQNSWSAIIGKRWQPKPWEAIALSAHGWAHLFRNTRSFLFMKSKLFLLNSATKFTVNQKHFNKPGERADCTVTQNVLWGLRKPVKLFFKCVSMRK